MIVAALFGNIGLPIAKGAKMQDSAANQPQVVVEKVRRPARPRRHHLETEPPPPMAVWTVAQVEAEHPGLKGRLRQWIKRADAGDPAYRWLIFCTIRIGGNVFIDEVRFRDELHLRTAIPPRPGRNAVAA